MKPTSFISNKKDDKAAENRDSMKGNFELSSGAIDDQSMDSNEEIDTLNAFVDNKKNHFNKNQNVNKDNNLIVSYNSNSEYFDENFYC